MCKWSDTTGRCKDCTQHAIYGQPTALGRVAHACAAACLPVSACRRLYPAHLSCRSHNGCKICSSYKINRENTDARSQACEQFNPRRTGPPGQLQNRNRSSLREGGPASRPSQDPLGIPEVLPRRCQPPSLHCARADACFLERGRPGFAWTGRWSRPQLRRSPAQDRTPSFRHQGQYCRPSPN